MKEGRGWRDGEVVKRVEGRLRAGRGQRGVEGSGGIGESKVKARARARAWTCPSRLIDKMKKGSEHQP
jgi:hypothetical protein